MGIEVAAVFLPLAGAMGAGLSRRGKTAAIVTSAAVLAAALFSILVLFRVASEGAISTVVLGTWIESGAMKAHWSLRIDTLSGLMMTVVNIISAMVHMYALRYMPVDKSLPRFMACLGLFTFFMLMLVTSGNLLQLFFGWEGVGLMSYLLIGFWYERPAASAAAIKAFLVNRIGDAGFLLGLFGCFVLFQTVRFETIFTLAPDLSGVSWSLAGFRVQALTVLCLLLFLGAMAKSAQIGLHTWLPDAMEGPTPVSALIHAATMVAAGVFMVVRLAPLYEQAPAALAVIAVVGAVTAFFAATVALVQFDIKRVIAWSTISQLGYMFLALGLAAWGAALFHLVTHAFFKALLFLGAGSVIHALDGEQDMRRMGGLAQTMPATYMLMWIGTLALTGIGVDGLFGFSGFYSKDAILGAALASSSWVGTASYVLGLVAAFMTAFYAGRLVFLTFHGSRRTPVPAHESSWFMLAPVVPLALAAVFLGWIAEGWFLEAGHAGSWQGTVAGLPSSWGVKMLPSFFGLAGLSLAYVFYVRKPAWPTALAGRFRRTDAVLAAAYYVDAFYAAVFVRPAQKLGALLWRTGDERLIDGCGPDGVARFVTQLGRRATMLQTGYLPFYAFVMVLGLAGLMTWVLFNG